MWVARPWRGLIWPCTHACRLDNFLNYLQRYVLQKPQLPISIDFALTDTLEALRYVAQEGLLRARGAAARKRGCCAQEELLPLL